MAAIFDPNQAGVSAADPGVTDAVTFDPNRAGVAAKTFDPNAVGTQTQTFDANSAGNAASVNQNLSPLGQLIDQAKANPKAQDWGQILKFAFTHPIDYTKGLLHVGKEVAKEYPAASVKPYEEASQPAFHLPRVETSQGGVSGVAAGAVNAGEKVVESLSAPANLPLATTGLVLAPFRAIPSAAVGLRSLAAYFAASSAISAAKQSKTAVKTLANPQATTAEKTEAVLNPIMSAAMAAIAAKGALTNPIPAPAPKPLPTTGSLQTDLGYLDLVRTDAVQKWVTAPNPRKAIVFARDAVDTATERAANSAANDVAYDLKKTFGEADYSQADKALVPAVESGANTQALEAMRTTLENGSYKTPAKLEAAHEYINSINFAIDHLDDFASIVEKHNAITSAIYQHAQDSGIEFPYRQNYVLHAQDIEPPAGFGHPPSGGGAGMAFRKMRSFDNYADSIANGIAPKTDSAVDLLRSAVRATQGAVNRNLFSDALTQMVDPMNGQPILTSRPMVTRPDGTSYMDVPNGYSATMVGGRPMAVQNGYKGLFDALANPSVVNPLLSKVNAVGKSVRLAVDTYHLGRLAAYQAASNLSRGELPLPKYSKGLLLGDTPMSTIEQMAKNGEIDPKSLPQIREDKAIIDTLVNHGLNAGRISDSLHQEWVQQVPVLGRVNKFIFQQFQRGAIYDLGVKEFRYQQKNMPWLSNEEVARNVAQDVNTRLGNLGRQGIFKSQTAQDLARIGFLAPQWNEALIRSELGGAAQLLKAVPKALETGRYSPGLLGRVAGTLLVGQFAANQLINLYTRGIPTWQNPEEGLGAKLSAWVPDEIGSSHGFFLNPTILPFEVTHLLEKGFERTGDWRDSLGSYFRGRLSSTTQPVADLMLKRNAIGRPLTTGEALMDAVPVPIAGDALYNASRQLITHQPSESFPGQYQKQAMATFGLRVDTAPSPEQRMAVLASDYKRDHGMSTDAQFYSGDYQPFTLAMRTGNQQQAQVEFQKLLTKKTPDAIVKHFAESFRYPFTGSYTREADFFKGLTDEQKHTYMRARQDKIALAKRALGFIAQQLHDPAP